MTLRGRLKLSQEIDRAWRYSCALSPTTRWGVPVLESEVYGMLPAKALLESAAYYMQIKDFDLNQVVDMAMLNIV